MSRPKGSKNRVKDNNMEKGNPKFNLRDAEPVSPTWIETPPNTPSVASSAILPEDLELERKLQAMTMQDDPGLAQISDRDPMIIVRSDEPKPLLLSAHMPEYGLVTSFDDLKQQVYMAKLEGCDSIVAEPGFAKKVCRDPSLEKVGYFIYHDIKVYLDGQTERAMKRDNETIEQRTFGQGAQRIW
jgi:hypothetical protein